MFFVSDALKSYYGQLASLAVFLVFGGNVSAHEGVVWPPTDANGGCPGIELREEHKGGS